MRYRLSSVVLMLAGLVGCTELSAEDRALITSANQAAREAKEQSIEATDEARQAREDAARAAADAKAARNAAEQAGDKADRIFRQGQRK